MSRVNSWSLGLCVLCVAAVGCAEETGDDSADVTVASADEVDDQATTTTVWGCNATPGTAQLVTNSAGKLAIRARASFSCSAYPGTRYINVWVWGPAGDYLGSENGVNNGLNSVGTSAASGTKYSSLVTKPSGSASWKSGAQVYSSSGASHSTGVYSGAVTF